MDGEAVLMAGPYDYNSILSVQPSGGMADVVRNAIFGEQQRVQNENTLAQQAAAIEKAKQAEELAAQRRAQQQQLWGEMVKAPTPANVFSYMSAFPEMSEGVKRAYDVLQPAQQQAELRTMVDVQAALHAGKPDVAKSILKAREEADAKAGIDTSHYGKLAEIIDADPAHANGLGLLALASVVGKDKFAETYGKLGEEARANELQPSKVQQAGAEADIKTAEAEAKPEMIKSDLETADATRKRMAAQTANEIEELSLKRAGLALERDKLESGIEVKLQEMSQNGVKPDPASIGIMNTAAGESVSADMLANKEKDLAGRIRAAGLSSGPFASLSEGLKRITGDQNAYTQLRAEWEQLKNKAALGNRKDMPGAMSDADREFLLKGFPPTNASPEYLAHFLEVMAMGHRAVALSEDRKASWVGANGNLGPAKNDVSIKGTMVPKGTTFAEFMRSAAKLDTRGQLPTDIDALKQKYGK